MAEPNPAVAEGMVVTLDFTLTLQDGDVAETTQGGTPLRFLAGSGQLLPALEEALIGLAVGDEASITLAPEDGYGEFDEDAFEDVPSDQFPSGHEIQPGMAIGVKDASGEVFEAYVAEVRDDTVVLDYNHPLAGEELHFAIKVLDVRPATAEELEHGHAHDGHGHH